MSGFKWVQLELDEFDSTTALLSNEALGCYMRLVRLQLKKGHLPADVGLLNKLVPGVAKVWEELEEEFPEVDGKRLNRSWAVERDRAISSCEAASNHGRMMANRRHHKPGGHPSDDTPPRRARSSAGGNAGSNGASIAHSTTSSIAISNAGSSATSISTAMQTETGDRESEEPSSSSPEAVAGARPSTPAMGSTTTTVVDREYPGAGTVQDRAREKLSKVLTGQALAEAAGIIAAWPDAKLGADLDHLLKLAGVAEKPAPYLMALLEKRRNAYPPRDGQPSLRLVRTARAPDATLERMRADHASADVEKFCVDATLEPLDSAALAAVKRQVIEHTTNPTKRSILSTLDPLKSRMLRIEMATFIEASRAAKAATA